MGNKMDIYHGQEVELTFKPADGWKFSKKQSSIGQNPWVMTEDKHVHVVFVKKEPEYDHAFAIPHEAWVNMLADDEIRNWFRHPDYDHIGRSGNFLSDVIFQFRGCPESVFDMVPPGGRMHSEYPSIAEDMANCIKRDFELHGYDDCLFSVDFSVPIEPDMGDSLQEIMDKIENYETYSQTHALAVDKTGNGSIEVNVEGLKEKTF